MITPHCRLFCVVIPRAAPCTWEVDHLSALTDVESAVEALPFPTRSAVRLKVDKRHASMFTPPIEGVTGSRGGTNASPPPRRKNQRLL